LGTVVGGWAAVPDAYDYQIRHMDRYHPRNGYENRSWEQNNTGSWVDVVGAGDLTG
jgi:hypothetical protein